jgi:hypothetical protein
MNVKDLIELLGAYDKELIVSVDGYEAGVTDKFKVGVIRVKLNANTESYYGEHKDYCNEQADGIRLNISRGY